MGAFVRGDVVVTQFPFADLTSSKKRPCVILASFPKDRVILCPITSQNPSDGFAIELNDADFKTGSLKRQSFIRPNYLFTAETKIIDYRAGVLTDTKIHETSQRLIQLMSTD